MAGSTTDVVARYRIDEGKGFRLARFDPSDTAELTNKLKRKAKDLLAQDVERLRLLQGELYAQDRWAVLIVLQGMDASGKDSTINHVMSGVNPQGCQVSSFKAPSDEELDHDFLWRTVRALPERGRIGIFNRSYYEEVLVVRVHPELLARERLPSTLVGKHLWQERYEDIAAFERYLGRNGVVIRKFFLHVSKEEQRRRFLRRLDDPAKNWKFSLADVRERQRWTEYMDAYERMIRATSTPDAPWIVVPADHKWFAHLVVAGAVVDALERLDLSFPPLDPTRRNELRRARTALEREAGRRR
jgi:PPK2 family polyphosphate:nucleotide phosphotransferase